MSHRATVALVEWHWGGHNHTYYKHYLSALAECGAHVLPVMSQPHLLDGMMANPPLVNLGKGRDSVAAPVAFTPTGEWRIRPGRLAFKPVRRVAYQLGVWSTFRRLGRVLRQWERHHGQSIDLVFFACMYDGEFSRASLVSNGLRRPWSGLYLQGRVFHGLRSAAESSRIRRARVMFDSNRLVALGLLEPAVLKLALKAKPSINARLFPDTLEPISEAETEPASRLREEMLTRAKGRPIVSLLGALQPSKGVELFLRAACDPRLSDVAFFLGGSLPLERINPDFRACVEEGMRRAPHLHVCLEQLCENRFNAAVRGSDILFAAYLDFPYSSNVQGKAAQLHKPIIVTDGTLMAERCREYRLGECVRENDLESVVLAIQKIHSTAQERQADTDLMARHDEYTALNTHDAVHGAMEWVLRSANL